MNIPVVELKNILKVFPGVIALDDMSIKLMKGEIHGLVGENGAGKSTLIKVLSGVYKPDSGEIFIHGEKKEFDKPGDAHENGIACVYQELNIVKDSSVIDNLFIGNYKIRNGRLDKKYMRERTVEILKMLGQDLDPDIAAGKLGIGQQQMIEIGKAILLDAKVIILDEPTSSLGESETRDLFRIVRKLRSEEGITFLFVSHKLEELFELCDIVTVMRDSKHIISAETKELTNNELINHMVGRSLGDLYPKKPSKPGKVALSIKELTRLGEYYDISFEAKYGEILGFSGLVGAGRTELFHGIFGSITPDSGTIEINGKKCRNKTPQDAIANGIGLLTEDRKNQGLLLDFSVETNISLVIIDRIKKRFSLDKKRLKTIAENSINRLCIKVSSPMQLAGQLSGGNQQKVVIGKWLEADADIYIFDEPTKGIDVSAKIEVYNIMNELVQQGKCVIMISSELPEILGMSDRVIVMRSGRITASLDHESDKFNQEDIMKAAWGVN